MEDKQNYNLGKGELYITDSFGYVHKTNCDEFNIEFITTKKLKKIKAKKKPKITFNLNIEPFPVSLKG